MFGKPWSDRDRWRRVAEACEALAPVFDRKATPSTVRFLRESALALRGDASDEQARRVMVRLFEFVSAGRGGPFDEPVLDDAERIDGVSSARMIDLQKELGRLTSPIFRRSRELRSNGR